MPESGEVKGKGGRPKGSRNRVSREIRELAGKYSPRAVRHAWKLATEADDQSVQLKALELLLGYGHGKPTQRRELSGPEGEPQKLEYTTPELARRMLTLLDLASNEVAEGDPGGRGEAEGVCASASAFSPEKNSESENSPAAENEVSASHKNKKNHVKGDELVVNGVTLRCEGEREWVALQDEKILRKFNDAKFEWVAEWCELRAAS
jgi:hypothetical protein